MKEVIFAGFGGQGVLTAGLVLAYTAMEQERNTCWLPSYGAAMRGGKASSTVKFGDDTEEVIGVPMMAEADAMIAMSQLSLDYLKFCKPSATVLVNADVVDEATEYPDNLNIVKVHCNEIAYSVKNQKGASIVMVGALLKRMGFFDYDTLETSMLHMFAEKGKSKLDELNKAALKAGYEAV